VTSDPHILWKACSEAEDYFAHLGGSGRYSGFNDFHIPALVLITALEKIGISNDFNEPASRLLPKKLWTETGDLQERVRRIVDGLTYSEPDQMREFIEYVSRKYEEKEPDQLVGWEKFLKEIKELGCLI
jgi:hypothetical protein